MQQSAVRVMGMTARGTYCSVQVAETMLRMEPVMEARDEPGLAFWNNDVGHLLVSALTWCVWDASIASVCPQRTQDGYAPCYI